MQRAARVAPLSLAAMAVVYKLAWLAMGAVPFNGDEAIVALMARHILRGERPTFFYGQAYLGATDAWLTAISFSIFGESVAAIRLVQLALFAVFLLTSYLIARRVGLSEWGARAAMLWLALPPTMLTLYTTATLGGYGETLVLGNIAILLAESIVRDATSAAGGKWLVHSVGRWLALGLVAGLGLYTFPLILIYLLPIGLWLLFSCWLKTWHGYLMTMAGFIVGSAPWWWALIQSGGRELAELAGAGVANTIPGAAYFETLGVRVLNFFLFGASAWWGLRYPWSAELVLPVMGVVVLAVYAGALAYATRRAKHPGQNVVKPGDVGGGRGDVRFLRRQPPNDARASAPDARLVLWGMVGALLITYLVTPFGGDPSGRYFLPLYLPLSIAVAMFLQAIRNTKRTFVTLLLAGLIVYNVAGTALAAAVRPPGITTQFDPVTWIDHTRDQELIDFLLARGETRGYTNYWVQTPIAFLSQERIISMAALPYHLNLGYTPRDDRYPPYTQAVARAGRAFYITTNLPQLDTLIRDSLNRLDVSFNEKLIGNYQVYYGLSRKVTPQELGIGNR